MTRMKIPMLANPQSLLDLSNYLYIGAAVVAVIATFSIVYFGNRVASLKDAELKAYQKGADARIAEAHAQSAKADAQAAQANILVAKSNQTAAEAQAAASAANQRAEEAKATAEQSRLDKAKIEASNLLLQQQVEQERNARLAIENRLAPRNMVAAQQQLAIAALRKEAALVVDIVIYPSNTEAENLGGQINYIFEQLKWDTHGAQPVGGSYKGVKIEYAASDDEALRVVMIVAQALQLSGIECAVVTQLPPLLEDIGGFQSDGVTGTGRVRIIVGSK